MIYGSLHVALMQDKVSLGSEVFSLQFVVMGWFWLVSQIQYSKQDEVGGMEVVPDTVQCDTYSICQGGREIVYAL